ncbi:Tfp pilus assembly protein PilX [Legionella birminghamensis]|uniref:Tfp pilus assembly protein PilX n=1 Tax=Legionella birminghamensis TaxID=28083 RepID=A0A378IAQ0_9GAMM|nr:PilX N-terminal domain-containing pilus assembly protein [Legionella birminghamensis]KTC69513.1 Tfp pilus assembly protein PilX [Legionella birminghamensis]STX32318.1 type IV pilus assembly protein PilX [Legionella birminghamensis]
MNQDWRKGQRGAVLAVSLLLLLIITLLAISAVQVTQMQEKMSANLQNKELSFLAAETALIAGENWVLTQSRQPQVYTLCTNFPCAQELYENIDFASQPDSWWKTNSAQYNSNLKQVSSKPRYIIEFLQFVPDSPVIGSSSSKSTGVFYYQVTAKGYGFSDEAVTVLQTTVGRRF